MLATALDVQVYGLTPDAKGEQYLESKKIQEMQNEELCRNYGAELASFADMPIKDKPVKSTGSKLTELHNEVLERVASSKLNPKECTSWSMDVWQTINQSN